MGIDEKWNALLTLIRGLGRSVVAFSGGVDSALLCKAAVEGLGDEALAITVVSPLIPERELRDAREIVALVGIQHLLIQVSKLSEEVAANPVDRCYHCKKLNMGLIIGAAREKGYSLVLDGSNVDDLADYRPGGRALKELGVRSPLQESGLTKAEIRELSRRLGLPTWDKSAFACLASRIPYGDRLEPGILARVAAAEDDLAAFGFRQYRVRVHGDIARVEVAREERRRLFDEDRLDAISKAVKARGFQYVAFEAEGYSMGSMNVNLGRKE